MLRDLKPKMPGSRQTRSYLQKLPRYRNYHSLTGPRPHFLNVLPDFVPGQISHREKAVRVLDAEKIAKNTNLEGTGEPGLLQIQHALQRALLMLNFFLQQRDRIQQLFRPWRTSRHINIDWYHLIHALH